MPRDNNAVLQLTNTITSSFNSSGVDLGTGTPRAGMVAAVRVSGFSGSDTSVSFKIQHSADNSTFTDLAFPTKTPVTAVGETWIPFETDKRYVRLVATVSGTTPVVTYSAGIVAGRP